MEPCNVRLLSIIVAACVTASCGIQSRVLSSRPQPAARIEAIKVGLFDRQNARLEVVLQIENPGGEMQVKVADYEVLLDERTFAVGKARLNATLAAKATTSLVMPIELSFVALPKRARDRADRGEPVPLVVRGALLAFRGVTAHSIELDGETEVTLAAEGWRD